MIETLLETQAINKAIVNWQTFGHLAPKRQKEYKGFILFTHSAYGDIVVLDSIFKGLDDSPWIYEDTYKYIGKYVDKNIENTGVFRFEGIYKKFKNGNPCFKGKIKKIIKI